MVAMTSPWTLLIAAAAAAATTTIWWQLAVRRLPEPEDPKEPKRPYRELSGPTHTAAVAATSAASAALIVWTAPPATWAIWAVLATAGALVAGIDAFTTWMPRRAAWSSWALLTAAIAITVAWSPTTALAATAGAIGSCALFLILWLIMRGTFGFGDVRFMPLIGAATAATSLTCLQIALIGGALLVVIYAIVDRTIHHTIRFLPWGPAYYLAAVSCLAWA